MPTLMVHERRSRCPHWWCTGVTQPMPTICWCTIHAADAHSGGARATQPMPTMCWCTSKPTVRYRLVYSRCPLWWCTSDTADAHHMLVHEQANSTIQVGRQPMPTLVVHERRSRCPSYAGARASQQYDKGWCTADAHTSGARATRPMPTICWCTSEPTVRYRLVYSRCPH